MQSASESLNSSKSLVVRASMACAACRMRKRKCDGQVPCSYCVAKNQECSFAEKKKRGPKKRTIECLDDAVTIVNPSPIDAFMSDKAEAFLYFDTCWKHTHRIHCLSTASKIKNPMTIAHKVQAYSIFAYTARICGNKQKSLVYYDQARAMAGQIFDVPNLDNVSALLLMSYYSMINFDLPRASYYASLGSSLAKMIPRERLDYRLYLFCQITAIMADTESTGEQRNVKFMELLDFAKGINNPQDKMVPVFLLFVELHRVLIQLFHHKKYYSDPNSTLVFNMLDDIMLTEASRLQVFDVMNNIIIRMQDSELANHSTFITKLVIPSHRAIVNWKSGHKIEAMESALTCFAGLQILDEDCLYGLLSHLPQMYLICSLVKLFLEQGQNLLAQQMGEHIKSICRRNSPELDGICEQLDNLILSHIPASSKVEEINTNTNKNTPFDYLNIFSNNTTTTTNHTCTSSPWSTPSPTYSPSPPSHSSPSPPSSAPSPSNTISPFASPAHLSTPQTPQANNFSQNNYNVPPNIYFPNSQSTNNTQHNSQTNNYNAQNNNMQPNEPQNYNNNNAISIEEFQLPLDWNPNVELDITTIEKILQL